MLLLPPQSPFKNPDVPSSNTQQAVGNRSQSSIRSTSRPKIEGRRAKSQEHRITNDEYIKLLEAKAKIDKKMSKVRFTEPFGESIKHIPFKIENIGSSEDDSDSYNESTCCMCLAERQRRSIENRLDEILAKTTGKSNYIALPETSIDSSIFVNGEVTNPQNAFLTNTFDMDCVLAATNYPLVYVLKNSIKGEKTTTIEKGNLPRDKKSIKALEKDQTNFVELYPSLLKKSRDLATRGIEAMAVSRKEDDAKKFVRPIKVKVGRKITMDDVDQIVVNKKIAVLCNEVSKNVPECGSIALGQMVEYSDYLQKPVELLGKVELDDDRDAYTVLKNAAQQAMRAIKFKQVTGMS